MTTPRRLDLTLTLVDDVVLSARPANEGGHESLDYIPGAALLGAVAHRLYGTLERKEAWQVFHSGALRFGDGVPLSDGHPCWPMPLCWHHAKGVEVEVDERLIDAAIGTPVQLLVRDPRTQPKQLRDGHVRADGLVARPAKSLRMKTALDPATGRIAESQLFGYESLNAGQSFAARIESDAELPEALWQQVTGLFGQPLELLLGRSRSAEYGRVRAVASSSLALSPASGSASTKRLVLWCLSDLALLDDFGQPTLHPAPGHFGLDRGRIDWENTFLRFRQLASWNAWRQAYDLQRQVIRRGSVITLIDIEPPLNAAEHTRIAAGVGLHREQGLGRVCPDPALLDGLLDGRAPQFAAPPKPVGVESDASKNTLAKPDSPLIRWLERQQSGSRSRRDDEVRAQAQATELATRYRLARTFSGVPEQVPIGPSPAQWGTVYEAARTTSDRHTLISTLFEGQNALCRESGEHWPEQFRDADGVRSFLDWFKDTAAPALTTITAFRLFGREAQRIAQREYRQG